MLSANEVIIRAAMLTGFRDLVAARGIDFDKLLDEAGLARSALDHPANELPVNAVALLMEIAAERTDDPGLGLAYAEAFPPGASGLLGYITLHASTIGEALQAFARYSGLICYPSPVQLREEGRTTALTWCIPTGRNTRRVQFASFVNAILTLRLRQMAGRDWRPIGVEVEHPELPCPALLHRIFGPRVTFNARENLILIDRCTLQRQTQGADPQLFQILQEYAEVKLREMATRPDIVARTSRAITETLNTHPPLLERVAERMRMTPRSLQNRLAQHGTTFERVLSDTRRSLAERYLRDTELPLTEIAFLLGFSEQSAFTRAARTWFGRPPRQLRKEGGWTGLTADSKEA